MFLGAPDWDELLAARRRRQPAATLARAPGGDAVRRPDQHPVHERHDRLPEGRHAQPPQHPQQRLLRRRGLPLHARPTASASRCPSTTASAWCWATSACITHGAVHGRSRRRRSSRARRSQAVAGRALHERSTACRRCSSPSSSTRDFAEFDLSLAAHRDHGRLAVPGRGDAPRHRPRCTWSEVTICYGMTETSPVSTQTGADDPLEQARRHGRARAPARRGQGRRPGHRARSCARGETGRAVHARLLGDARLLGRRRSARREAIDAGALDAHRRPRRRWTTRATSTSSAASRTWSSAAARTSTRARSRSSSTPTPTSPTCRSSACPTRATARS